MAVMSVKTEKRLKKCELKSVSFFFFFFLSCCLRSTVFFLYSILGGTFWINSSIVNISDTFLLFAMLLGFFFFFSIHSYISQQIDDDQMKINLKLKYEWLNCCRFLCEPLCVYEKCVNFSVKIVYFGFLFGWCSSFFFFFRKILLFWFLTANIFVVDADVLDTLLTFNNVITNIVRYCF